MKPTKEERLKERLWRMLTTLQNTGGDLAGHYGYAELEQAVSQGLIEDVPWQERPHSPALRWIRLTPTGRTVLEKEG